jgi:hypothetical protein
MFVAFAALFAVLAWATARPVPSRDQAESTSTRFVPSWFLEGAILLVVLVVLLNLGFCIFGGKH